MKLNNRSARPDSVPLNHLNYGEAFITNGGAVYIKLAHWEDDWSHTNALALRDGEARVGTVSFNSDYPVTRVRLDDITFTEVPS